MQAILLWLFRFGLHRGIKYLAKHMKKARTWENAQRLRRWMKRELLLAIKWFEKKTPDFTADEDLVKLFAWALESDELAAKFNEDKPASQRIDAHLVPGAGQSPRMPDQTLDRIVVDGE